MEKVKLTQYKKLGNIINRIYKITSPSNRVYIGYTTSIVRFKCYCNKSCKKQTKIYRSLVKYGVQNHYLQILTGQSKAKNLIAYQKAFIRYYDSFKNGLNCSLGGQGGLVYSDQFCESIWQMNKNGMNFNQISNIVNIEHCGVKLLIKRTGNTPIIHKRNPLRYSGPKSQQHKRRISASNLKIIPKYAINQHGEIMPVKSIRCNHLKSDWHYQSNRLALQNNRKMK